MARHLYRIGVACGRYARATVSGWILVLLALGAVALSGAHVSGGDTRIADTESSRALARIERAFPSAKAAAEAETLKLVFTTEGHRSVADPARRAAIEDALKTVQTVDHVSSVSDPFGAQEPMVSTNGNTAVSMVGFAHVPKDEQKSVKAEVKNAVDDATASQVTALVGGELGADEVTVFGPTEAVGVVVAFLVLLLTFGSLVAAGANLLGALVGVIVGILGVLAFSAFSPIGTTTPVLAIMLGLAVGIDYGLFILARFRHELRVGRSVEEAIGTAAGTAGTSVAFAGITVIIALAGLSVVGISFITEMGLAGALAVLVAVLMAITLLPAVMSLLGRRLLGRRARDRVTADGDPTKRGFLASWAARVVERPARFLVATGALLAVAAVPILSMHTALGVPGGPDPGSETRRAYHRIAQDFGAGSQDPLVVVVEGKSAGSDLPAVTTALEHLKGVVSVVPGPTSEGGTVATATVIARTGPLDAGTRHLVATIRALHVPGAHADLSVTGQTAIDLDVSRSISSALRTYLFVVVGLSLVLLTLLFRSLLVPAIATLGFLLSLGAAIGSAVAVFQWGWFGALVQAPQGDPLLSLLPILVTGILFGLAMDYQVFLVSRMHEAHERGLPAREAILDGFGRTAPIVVAAATIMGSVFAGFALSPSPFVAPIGLALGVGVLTDAFLVRMVIIPALLSLLGEKAWWLPAWLERVLPHVDAEGRSLDDPAEADHDAGSEVGRLVGAR